MYSKLNLPDLPADSGGRIVLQKGTVIDPLNEIEAVMDVVIEDGRIHEVCINADTFPGDRIIDCRGLEVWPGLIDMHLHICDLYEVHTNTAYGAVQDGVTTGLTPGAGNTFMTPALLGAEMDRGLPLNVGAYLGGANVLGTMLNTEELIRLFQGTLPEAVKEQKMTRNGIVNQTAQYAVGLKEHMGHFLLPDEKVQTLFEITEQAGLIFMSHTQDVEHTLRIHSLSDGRKMHLGHANAAGCGTHQEPEEAMKRMIRLCREENVTAEFVTTMLRRGLGSREGIMMSRKAQERALQALADGTVRILVSDGQNQSTMKGFGDTRDNIPCILELTENQVLDRRSAVAAMTSHPAQLLYERTGNEDWKNYGSLSRGSYANVTVVDPEDKLAAYVITNGILTSFENRYLRSAGKAGAWVSKFGTKKNMGVGTLPLYKVK